MLGKIIAAPVDLRDVTGIEAGADALAWRTQTFRFIQTDFGSVKFSGAADWFWDFGCRGHRGARRVLDALNFDAEPHNAVVSTYLPRRGTGGAGTASGRNRVRRPRFCPSRPMGRPWGQGRSQSLLESACAGLRRSGQTR